MVIKFRTIKPNNRSEMSDDTITEAILCFRNVRVCKYNWLTLPTIVFTPNTWEDMLRIRTRVQNTISARNSEINKNKYCAYLKSLPSINKTNTPPCSNCVN